MLCCIFFLFCFFDSLFFQDLLPNPPFITMVLSSSLKPFSFITALISLMSFHNPVSLHLCALSRVFAFTVLSSILLHMTYCIV